MTIFPLLLEVSVTQGIAADEPRLSVSACNFLLWQMVASNGEQLSMEEKTIMIVEDDPLQAEILHDLLVEETPYRSIVASEARTTLKFLAHSRFKPDLFLLDYRLPGMDGIELYRQIRQRKEFCKVPALLLSAAPPSPSKRTASLATIRKPFALDDLLAAIEQLLAG